MAKTAEHTKRATFMSGLISIPFFLMVGAIGLVALVMDPHLSANSPLPYVAMTVLPVGLRGFVIAGILSVIMSSAAGFLNSGAVAVVNDIVKQVKRDPASEKQLLWWARLSTLAIGIVAVGFALAITNVLDILLYAYNFWSPIIIVPLVAVIFNLPVRFKHFAVGAVAGILCNLIWTNVFNMPGGVSGVLVGVAANFIAFSSVLMLESPRKTATEPLN